MQVEFAEIGSGVAVLAMGRFKVQHVAEGATARGAIRGRQGLLHGNADCRSDRSRSAANDGEQRIGGTQELIEEMILSPYM